MAPDPAAGAFSIPDEIARDLIRRHPVSPRIYWADLGLSAGLGWATFAGSLLVPFGGLSWFLLTAVCVITFLRAALFNHELAHRSRKELPGFHAVWGLLVGLPVGVPEIMVAEHGAHHATATFGTVADPEYAAISRWTRLRLLWATAGFALVPIFLPLRWLFVAPVSRVHPLLRSHAVRRLSTVDINPQYDRPWPSGEAAARFSRQEAACFGFFAVGVAATVVGWLPLMVHVQRFVVMAVAVTINYLRTLVVHRYDLDGDRVSLGEQVADATTLGGHPAWELVAPLGLRWHAAHHALPTLPYHALQAAHERLLAELPPGSAYHRTVGGGLLERLSSLLSDLPWSGPSGQLRLDPLASMLGVAADRSVRRSGPLWGRRQPAWFNLGYWPGARTFPEACAALADRLGEAAELGPGQDILDAGIGGGMQLPRWLERFGVERVRGIDISPLHVQGARLLLQERGLAERALLTPGDAGELLEQVGEQRFDRVLTLDCAYHFPDRAHFLRQAAAVLRPGGRVALADAVLSAAAVQAVGEGTGITAWWARLCCAIGGIPGRNLLGQAAFARQLTDAGFVDVRIVELPGVLEGFARASFDPTVPILRFVPLNLWGLHIVTAPLMALLQLVGRPAFRYVLVSGRRPAE